MKVPDPHARRSHLRPFKEAGQMKNARVKSTPMLSHGDKGAMVTERGGPVSWSAFIASALSRVLSVAWSPRWYPLTTLVAGEIAVRVLCVLLK